jgi:ABC-2 type transport system ATP-binding protein
LASDVELLLLDEPTSGLDPLMEAEFRRCIVEERDRGRTVLLSSHILSEVESACSHVTIIREGRTVESGSLDDLRHLTDLVVAAELDGPAPAALADLPGVSALVVDGPHLECRVTNDGLDALLRGLTAVGVRSLSSQPPSLDDLFLRYYDRAPAE